MIFVAMEYDAGASLHLSTRQSYFTCDAHSRKERHHPLIFPRESKARSRHLMKTSWKEQDMPSHKLEIRSPLIG
jgi:hypothetical protein